MHISAALIRLGELAADPVGVVIVDTEGRPACVSEARGKRVDDVAIGVVRPSEEQR